MAKKQYGLGHTRLTVPGRPDLTNKTAVVMVGDKTLEEALEEGGVSDYPDLTNKPSINGVELSGNKTSSDLGVATSQQGAKADTAYQKPQTGIPSTDLASEVQTSLGKADTAVQQVTVGTTTTGAAGSNASVNNSGTSTAPVFDFTIPRGTDGHNPNLGSYTDLSDAPTTNIQDGDFIVLIDTTQSPVTGTIYTWNGSAWQSTGRDANMAYFGSGELLADVHIDDTHLVNPKGGALPTAEDVMQLKAKLEGVTASEVKANFTIGNGYINTSGDLTGTTTNAHAEITLSNGYNSIRFLGLVLTSEASGNVAYYSYSFYDENDTPISPKKYNIVESVPSGTTASKEYITSVPDNAVKFMCSIGGNNRANFYCYLQSGESVVDLIPEVVDNLEEGGSEKALSAEQGKLLNGTVQTQGESLQDIDVAVNGGTRIVEQTIVHPTTANGKYYNTNNASIPRSSSTKEGCHAASLTVQEGEQYIVSGIGGGTAASRLWALADADNVRNTTYIGAQTGSARTTPVTITIPQGMVRLVFNLATYDPNTDYVKKLVEEEVTGLDERVENLEEASTDLTLTEELINWTRIDKTIVSSSGDITAGSTNSKNIVEFISVRNGEKVHLQVTSNSSNNRTLRIGYSTSYPHAGVTGATISKKLSLSAGTNVDEVMISPFDGFMFAYFEYDVYFDVTYKYLIEKGDNKPFSILRNEKILCFGASTFQYVNSWSGKGIPAYLNDLTGAKVVRGAIGGTRLVPRGSGSYNALDISNLIHAWAVQDFTDVDAAVEALADTTITSIVNAIKAMKPDMTTIVTIYALENDVNNNANFTWGQQNDSTNATVFGAVNTIISDILTANPYIKIFWVSQNVSYHGSNGVSDRTTANWCENYQYTNGDIAGKTKPEIIEILKGQVERNHVPFIDIYHCGVTPANFGTFFLDNDNTHMYKGFDLLARRVAAGVVANYY